MEKLTNGELATEIQKLIERAEGDIPQDVTNQILSMMIQDTGRSIKKLRWETKDSFDEIRKELQESLSSMTSEILEQIAHLSKDIDLNRQELESIKKESKKYPSIPKWVAENRRKALAVVLGFFVFSQMWFISGFRFIILSTLLHTTGKLFGIPEDTLKQILDMLFA